MIAHLRSVWTAPAASPRPPARVWRDYALLAAIAVAVVLEASLSAASLPMLVLVAAIAPTVLWRRTRPLTMVVIAMATTALATVVLGDAESPFAAGFMIVLLYALARWGTGRSIVVGVVVVLAHLWFTEVLTGFALEDAIGAHVVVITVFLLGLAVRFRSGERSREVERARSLERERLARDVHDTVAHHVSAIAIRAQAGLATAAIDPHAATNALRVIETEASKSLTELRTMLRVLRYEDSAELHPGPGTADFQQLARTEPGGPAVNVTLTGALDDVPPAVLTTAYRIAQESVTNARRHANRASRIDVTVAADSEQVRVNVHDDGAPLGGPAAPGFGITGMRERAALLGGTCTVGPAEHGGWAVTAVLPRTGRPA